MKRKCHDPKHKGRKTIDISEFSPSLRAPDGTIIKYHARCKKCRSRAHSERVRLKRISEGKPPRRIKLERAVRLSRKRARYHDKVDPRLPFSYFHEWLTDRVNKSSKAEVARKVGVSEDRVRYLLKGFSYKNGKKYEIRHIRHSTIDRFMEPFGEVPSMIYPTGMISTYRAYKHEDNRRKRAT